MGGGNNKLLAEGGEGGVINTAGKMLPGEMKGFPSPGRLFNLFVVQCTLPVLHFIPAKKNKATLLCLKICLKQKPPTRPKKQRNQIIITSHLLTN